MELHLRDGVVAVGAGLAGIGGAPFEVLAVEAVDALEHAVVVARAARGVHLLGGGIERHGLAIAQTYALAILARGDLAVLVEGDLGNLDHRGAAALALAAGILHPSHPGALEFLFLGGGRRRVGGEDGAGDKHGANKQGRGENGFHGSRWFGVRVSGKEYACVRRVSSLRWPPKAGQVQTLTLNLRQVKCGKCALKEAESCQNVIQTKKDGKPVTYFLVENEISKAFHGKLCKESRQVTATGTVKELDGKLYLTATKLDLAG